MANAPLFIQVCRQMGLPEPLPEHKFHPGRKWRIDFYFENGDRKVALEVEGGVHTGGRHTRGAGFESDMEKYNALAVAGIFLYRVTPKNLLKEPLFTHLKSILYNT